jgi:hypothetical protein
MIFFHEGQLHGILGMHVDDDLSTGADYFFQNIVPRLKKRFVFGKWYVDKFVHCGREISRREDGAAIVKQINYAKGLEKINITRERAKHEDQEVTEVERSALRSGNGKLSWIARQSRIDLCFGTMKSKVMLSRAKVKQIKEFNSLVKKAKQHAEVGLTFVPISLDEEFTIVAIGDSAFETVVDQKTAAGYVVGLMATEDIKKGAGSFSILSFRSHLVKRSVKSTLAAETMAMDESVQAADWFRAAFAELHDEGYEVRHWEEHASRIPMLIVTDCKSLHDHLNKDGGPPPSEKRLAMDMQVLKDMISGRSVEIRW